MALTNVARIQAASEGDLRKFTQREIADYFSHYDVPFDYVKGVLRCMDTSRVPGKLRALFDNRGHFTSRDESVN